MGGVGNIIVSSLVRSPEMVISHQRLFTLNPLFFLKKKRATNRDAEFTNALRFQWHWGTVYQGGGETPKRHRNRNEKQNGDLNAARGSGAEWNVPRRCQCHPYEPSKTRSKFTPPKGPRNPENPRGIKGSPLGGPGDERWIYIFSCRFRPLWVRVVGGDANLHARAARSRPVRRSATGCMCECMPAACMLDSDGDARVIWNSTAAASRRPNQFFLRRWQQKDLDSDASRPGAVTPRSPRPVMRSKRAEQSNGPVHFQSISKANSETYIYAGGGQVACARVAWRGAFEFRSGAGRRRALLLLSSTTILFHAAAQYANPHYRLGTAGLAWLCM